MKEKLPDDLKIVICRKFGSSVWTLDLLLKYLNEELRAQENCISGTKSEHSEQVENIFSSSGLLSHAQQKKSYFCIFCKMNGHTAPRCRKVTNVTTRMDLLRKENRCFICLEIGHGSRQCKVKYSCKKCKGRHNISICQDTKSEGGNSPCNNPNKITSNHISTDANDCCSCSKSSIDAENVYLNSAQATSSVLLQTATGDVFSPEEQSHLVTRLLFDTGSQRSYITTRLKES